MRANRTECLEVLSIFVPKTVIQADRNHSYQKSMIRCCCVHVRSHKEKDAIVCFFADTRVNVIRCSKYFSPVVFLLICLPKQLPPV